MARTKHLGRSAAVALLLALGSCGDAGEDGSATDAGPRAAFGQACTATEDCESRLCVATAPGSAICTRSCDDDADCPTASNWGCVSPGGVSYTVCGCVPDADEEVCGDGADNDCNGEVDDCMVCYGRPIAPDDPRHCGRCDNACSADQECRDGACQCPDGLLECGSSCVDVLSNRSHCGECGNRCASVQHCVSGECRCTDPTRPDYCESIGCIDLDTDPANCGACDVTCGAGQTCREGECTCPTASQPDHCEGVGCVDLQTDTSHCGTCGNACPGGWTCQAGTCTCPPHLPTACGTTCVDTDTDPSHCGACDSPCPSPRTCSGGVCACPWVDQEYCDGVCVDTSHDLAHCGSCGVACGPGEVCGGGTCFCPSGLVCGGTCMGSNDRNNCGACGNVCGSSQYCSGGTCVCSTSSQTACGTQCVYLSSDEGHCGTCGNACRPTEYCSAGTCRCPSGQTWCASAGACVSLASDTTNCGACGNACRPTEVCWSGACRCPSGQTWCDSAGACISTGSDESHCGACDSPCRATEVCSSGSCICPVGGQQWCASTGACQDLRSDESHCGACDAVCPTDTYCYYGTCRCNTSGETLCGSECVQLDTDPLHCGACGNVCPGTTTCVTGVCMCPDPSVGTPVRVSASIGASYNPRAASNGTHVLAVWPDSRTVSGSISNLYARLLNPDGTTAGPETLLDTLVTAYRRPDVVWDGTRWTVAYTKSSALHVIFVDSTGSPSAPVDLQTVAPGGTTVGHNPRLAWSSTSGLAAVGSISSYGDIHFQHLGMDGVTPAAPIRVGPSGLGAVAAGDAGGWGTLVASNTYGLTLGYINPDGSRTLPFVSLHSTTRFRGIDLAHDGATWVAAWYYEEYVSGSGIRHIIELARGDTLSNRAEAYSVFLDDNVSPSRVVSGPALSILGDDIAVAWIEDVDPDRTILAHRAFATRMAVPSDTTSAPAPRSGRFQLLPTSTADYTSLIDIVHGNASTLTSVWSDLRWGDTEVYAGAADISLCP